MPQNATDNVSSLSTAQLVAAMFATLHVMFNHRLVAGRVNSTQAQTAYDAGAVASTQ